MQWIDCGHRTLRFVTKARNSAKAIARFQAAAASLTKEAKRPPGLKYSSGGLAARLGYRGGDASPSPCQSARLSEARLYRIEQLVKFRKVRLGQRKAELPDIRSTRRKVGSLVYLFNVLDVVCFSVEAANHCTRLTYRNPFFHDRSHRIYHPGSV